MTTRSPLDPARLAHLASALGFRLDAAEAEIYCDAIRALEQGLDEIAALPEDRPPPRANRRTWTAATPEDDPGRVFITRCDVRGAPSGPLAGKRVGLKDNVSLAGVPMTLGSRFLEGYVPDVDATIVTRLLDAGATIVGKLNMDDFSRAALGMGTGMGSYGRPANPHAANALTGGSSSGSAAAVGTGAVDLAIGGDQGGSIRIPASWCGVVGLKPTFGLVPHTAVVGIEPSVDYVGPMGPSVADVAAMLQCIAGPDGYDPRQVDIPAMPDYVAELGAGIADLRIGVLQEGLAGRDTEPDVAAAVHAAVAVLREAGARVEMVSIPEHRTCGRLYGPLSFLGQGAQIGAGGERFLRGFHDTHLARALATALEQRADMLPPAAKLSWLFRTHVGVHAAIHHGRIQNARRLYRRAYDSALANLDCLVMPTTPVKAQYYEPPADARESLTRSLFRPTLKTLARNTTPFNITGHPALSVPCAMSKGLPVGMMLVGRHFDEGLLLRIARGFEERRDWRIDHPQHPSA